jgi:hypothetical protein
MTQTADKIEPPPADARERELEEVLANSGGDVLAALRKALTRRRSVRNEAPAQVTLDWFMRAG